MKVGLPKLTCVKEGRDMKSSILNHLCADDRARMVSILKVTLDKLSDSASSCAGWGDRGRGHIYFEHLRWFPPEMQDRRFTAAA
jgi:hypothetical protein